MGTLKTVFPYNNLNLYLYLGPGALDWNLSDRNSYLFGCVALLAYAPLGALRREQEGGRVSPSRRPILRETARTDPPQAMLRCQRAQRAPAVAASSITPYSIVKWFLSCLRSSSESWCPSQSSSALVASSNDSWKSPSL